MNYSGHNCHHIMYDYIIPTPFCGTSTYLLFGGR